MSAPIVRLNSTVTVQVDQNAVAGLSRPGGMVDVWTRDQAQQVATVARREAPSRTGRLRASIVARRAQDVSGRFVSGWEVSATAPYAAFVHQGTRPHVILPRRRQFLRFQVGGTFVFARRVQHPGTRPRPFLMDAARAVIPR